MKIFLESSNLDNLGKPDQLQCPPTWATLQKSTTRGKPTWPPEKVILELFCIGKVAILCYNFNHCGGVMPYGNIGSGNYLSPVHCQSITLANADLLSTGPLGTNFTDIWIKIQKFSYTKISLQMLSPKLWPFWLGLNMWQYLFKYGMTL